MNGICNVEQKQKRSLVSLLTVWNSIRLNIIYELSHILSEKLLLEERTYEYEFV